MIPPPPQKYTSVSGDTSSMIFWWLQKKRENAVSSKTMKKISSGGRLCFFLLRCRQKKFQPKAVYAGPQRDTARTRNGDERSGTKDDALHVHCCPELCKCVKLPQEPVFSICSHLCRADPRLALPWSCWLCQTPVDTHVQRKPDIISATDTNKMSATTRGTFVSSVPQQA